MLRILMVCAAVLLAASVSEACGKRGQRGGNCGQPACNQPVRVVSNCAPVAHPGFAAPGFAQPAFQPGFQQPGIVQPGFQQFQPAPRPMTGNPPAGTILPGPIPGVQPSPAPAPVQPPKSGEKSGEKGKSGEDNIPPSPGSNIPTPNPQPGSNPGNTIIGEVVIPEGQNIGRPIIGGTFPDGQPIIIGQAYYAGTSIPFGQQPAFNQHPGFNPNPGFAAQPACATQPIYYGTPVMGTCSGNKCNSGILFRGR